MKRKLSTRQKTDNRPESESTVKSGLDRREALSRLLTVAAAASASGWLPRRARAAGMGLQREVPHVAGASVSGFFTAQEKLTISALAQLMIPDDDVAPGAYAAHVEDYIDFGMTYAELMRSPPSSVPGSRACRRWIKPAPSGSGRPLPLFHCPSARNCFPPWLRTRRIRRRRPKSSLSSRNNLL